MAMTVEEKKKYLDTLSLSNAFWWFIENCNSDDPDTTELFFHLRHRRLQERDNQAVSDLSWKLAVDNQLVVHHLLTEETSQNPEVAMRTLLETVQSIALDPQVSSAAQTLIAVGRAQVLDGWVSMEDREPPVDTPVFILRNTSPPTIAVGEIQWEHPTFEDSFQSYKYWDNPDDHGQDWEWDSVTHWMEPPPLPENYPQEIKKGETISELEDREDRTFRWLDA